MTSSWVVSSYPSMQLQTVARLEGNFNEDDHPPLTLTGCKNNKRRTSGILTLLDPGRFSNRVWPALTLCLTPLTVPFLLRMFTLFVVKVQSLVAPAYTSRSSGRSSSSEPGYPYRCPCTSPLVEGVLARSASELLVQSESRESEGPSSLNISLRMRPLLPEATRNLTRFCGFSWPSVSTVSSIADPLSPHMVHNRAAELREVHSESDCLSSWITTTVNPRSLNRAKNDREPVSCITVTLTPE